MGIKNIIGNLGILPRLAMDAYDKEHDKAEALKAENAALLAAQEGNKGMKKGGKVKKMAAGGYRKAADGCVQRGKTRGRMV